MNWSNFSFLHVVIMYIYLIYCKYIICFTYIYYLLYIAQQKIYVYGTFFSHEFAHFVAGNCIVRSTILNNNLIKTLMYNRGQQQHLVAYTDCWLTTELIFFSGSPSSNDRKKSGKPYTFPLSLSVLRGERRKDLERN